MRTEFKEWMIAEHYRVAQEEAMDFSLYLEKIMQIVKDTPNDAELGAKIRMMSR